MFREVPRALSSAALERLVAGFGVVAGHVAAGGLDGVEVQCSQASLIRQFLAADNTVDAADCAFLLAVLAAVRDGDRARPRARACACRATRASPGGLTVDDAVRLAVAVEPHVDYVNTAVGVATRTLPLIEPPMGVPAGYASHVPSAVRAAVSVPVIGVGRFTTPAQALEAVRSGSLRPRRRRARPDRRPVLRGEGAARGARAALHRLQPGVHRARGPRPAPGVRGEPACRS